METQIVASGLVFPEAPRWHDGQLWFSDIHARKVKRLSPDGTVESVVDVKAIPSGLGFTPQGELLIVTSRDGRLSRFSHGALIPVAEMGSLASGFCNDMVVDGQGRAFVGNTGFDFTVPQPKPSMAELILVQPSGEARVVARDMGFPNGSVITPDGRTLIVGETYAARLTAFDISSDGTLTNRRVWAQFDEVGFAAEKLPDRIGPDGICLDAEGAIWIASPGSHEVVRAMPGGEITHRIRASQIPYACMLGGRDRRTLYIATAKSHHAKELIANPQGRIEALTVAVPGAGYP